MKNHVLRPLFVVIAGVLALLVVRYFMVPEDFGAHESGYMYGWHRKGNEQEWKDFKVKYMQKDYCFDCHSDKQEAIKGSPHVIISCQNCHAREGVVAADHPDVTPKMHIDRGREQCLRCHAKLPYKGSGRMFVRGINNEEHNPEAMCVDCHNPHSPGFE